MRFSTAAAILLPVASVYAQTTTTVLVGDGGLTFTPETITAAVGDTVIFEFRGGNHTVTQSTFAAPCSVMTTPKAGIDSGFVPVAAGATEFSQWSITVDNATAPLWFYCKQGNHCQQGMVFSVNPTADKTHEAFKANAAAAVAGGAAASGASASGSAAATGAATATGSAASGSASASGTGSAAGAGASAAADNAAMGVRGNLASVLAAAAVFAGLVL